MDKIFTIHAGNKYLCSPGKQQILLYAFRHGNNTVTNAIPYNIYRIRFCNNNKPKTKILENMHKCTESHMNIVKT